MNRPTHGGNLAWAASIAGCPASLITDFSASINPLGPPKSALAAIQNQLEAISRYPDPHYPELRLALARWHQLPETWILPGNGSAELLTWASWELSQLEATYLPTPAFNDYWRALKTFSVRVEPCLMNLESDLLSGLAVKALKNRGLLLNNPHNPSGRLLTLDALLPYLETGALVVVDEAFMDFIPPQQQQSLVSIVQNYPNLIILRSLTKFYSLAGLRIGYAIAHPERLQRWLQWRDPWPVNCLAAAAAEAVIKDRAFQQLTWDWLPKARNQLLAGLAAITGLHPLAGTANFLLVRTEHSCSYLQEQLLKHHHLLIRDCLSFPELGDRYFRVAVKSQADNRRLIAALGTLLN